MGTAEEIPTRSQRKKDFQCFHILFKTIGFQPKVEEGNLNRKEKKIHIQGKGREKKEHT